MVGEPPVDCNQVIAAQTLAERLAAGYGEGDPHVIGWRWELGLVTGRP